MTKFSPPIEDEPVHAAFANFPTRAQKTLGALRRIIFDVAKSDASIEGITEALPWGEPAYIPISKQRGSLIRLGWKASAPNDCLLLFHCGTSLVSDFRSRFGDALRFQKNRAIVMDGHGVFDDEIIATCVHHALTYKR